MERKLLLEELYISEREDKEEWKERMRHRWRQQEREL